LYKPKVYCSNGVIVVLVQRGAKIDKTVDLSDLLGNLKNKVDCENILVIAQEYSSVKIYDKIGSNGGFAVSKVEFLVKEGADLAFVSRLGGYSVVFYLEKRAILDCFMLVTDEACVKKDFEIVLRGERARAVINGVYLVAGDQKFFLSVLQKHLAKHTSSFLRLHGVASGRSLVDFQGTIFVEKNAANANAEQAIKTLLFRNAKVDANPNIEILNNKEVTAKHKAAAGKVNSKILFYLRARGFTKARAEKLLIESFFDLFTISLDTQIKKDFAKRLQKKMRRLL